MLITRPNLRSRIPVQTGWVMLNRPAQVGVDNLFPGLRRHLVEHAVARDPGVVDQHIDRPQIRLDLGNTRRTGIVIRDRPFVGRDPGFRRERCSRCHRCPRSSQPPYSRPLSAPPISQRQFPGFPQSPMQSLPFWPPHLSLYNLVTQRKGGTQFNCAPPHYNPENQACSMHMATPMPPPMHNVARPFLAP